MIMVGDVRTEHLFPIRPLWHQAHLNVARPSHSRLSFEYGADVDNGHKNRDIAQIALAIPGERHEVALHNLNDPPADNEVGAFANVSD